MQHEFNFDGILEPDDPPRLGRQLAAVLELMRDGQWRTLEQLQYQLRVRGVEASQTSLSARLRDLRKKKFGGHQVDRDRIRPGLYQYRLEVAS